MPGKSRHKKWKQPVPSKKKGRSVHPSASVQQPAVAQTHETVPTPSIPAPLAQASSQVTKPTAVRYPYIATELRTISILGGIMLVVLVVLALLPLPW